MSLTRIQTVPDVETAQRIARDLYVIGRRMGETIALDAAADAQARAEAPTFREDHARWLANANARKVATVAQSADVLARSTAEILAELQANYDENGCRLIDEPGHDEDEPGDDRCWEELAEAPFSARAGRMGVAA